MQFQLGPRREVIGSLVANIIMPAGALRASVTDLYAYFKAINQHKIINKESKDLMFSKHATKVSSESMQYHIHYGYGFMLTQTGQAKSVGHGGVDLGVGSNFEALFLHSVVTTVIH
ncbi:MAG: serine hydrolase [Alteromonadaceae bacterium]|nr:serine hydrolase [Alteromonadaceae bacterium]